MSASVFINPPHAYFRADHLRHVIGEMRRRGAPALRAAWDEEAGVWHAREGTHRLRAALFLQLAPVLLPVRLEKRGEALRRARVAAARCAHMFAYAVIHRGRGGRPMSKREFTAADVNAAARRLVASGREAGMYKAYIADVRDSIAPDLTMSEFGEVLNGMRRRGEVVLSEASDMRELYSAVALAASEIRDVGPMGTHLTFHFVTLPPRY